jgi:transposase-like protein
MQSVSYARHQLPSEIIRHAVWLYLRFTSSGDVTLTGNIALYSSMNNLAA